MHTIWLSPLIQWPDREQLQETTAWPYHGALARRYYGLLQHQLLARKYAA